MSTVQDLYTSQAAKYLLLNTAFRYRHALEAFFADYDHLGPNLRVLDAGCGTGTATLALLRVLRRRNLREDAIHAFDLTPAMLSRFEERLARLRLFNVDLREGDILEPARLPEDWNDHDLVMSSGLLEHVPKTRLISVLGAMRERLRAGGWILLFVTRKTWVTRLVIENPWKASSYSASELRAALETAGYGSIRFLRFPSIYFCQNIWGHIVEAQRKEYSNGVMKPAPVS
jgi:ubiquinone/menaquinone biosynthesis C-methylase UbiE